jgi:ATP-binding protein involved in chromosome partitioning
MSTSSTPAVASIIAPIGFQKKGDTGLIVVWSDRKRSEYNVRDLRLSCPCAVCVNEWTGKKMLREQDVPENVHPLRIFSVGRYAMGVEWSDGHSTGIYGYDYMRRLSA